MPPLPVFPGRCAPGPRLAVDDLAAARVLIADGSTALRIAGFLAQQAAEKSLKAGLFAASIEAPKIHGLSQLLARYPKDRVPVVDPDDLDVLDPWVIDGRYAADLPDVDRHQAEDLLQAAHRVVESVRTSTPTVEPAR